MWIYTQKLYKFIIFQNYSEKNFKIMPKIIPPIYFYNAIIVAPKRIRFKSIPQSCSPKLLPKGAAQSYVLKLVSYSAKLRFFKAAIQTYLAKLLLKPASFPKAAPESCSPKRFPAATSQNRSQNTTAKRLPQSGYASNLFPKAVPQSYSPKWLPKAVPQSCYQKLPPQNCVLKLIPKAAVFQSKATVRSMLLQSRKVVPHNYSPKLLSKIATESRVPKKLSKPVRAS